MSDLAEMTLTENSYGPNQADTAEKGLHVTFYKHPVDGQDHIKIEFPLDDKMVVDELADDRYKMRFPRQWSIYKGQLEEFAGQVRIETVTWIDPGMIQDMKRANIHTVEYLAEISDSAIGSADMIGLMAFRQKAKEHLAEKAKSSQYDTLQAQNAELMKRLEKLEQGRGRKA